MARPYQHKTEVIIGPSLFDGGEGIPPLICSIDRQISEISPASPFGSDFIAMVSDGSVEVEDAPWTFAGFLHEIIEIERGKEGEDVAFAPARMPGVGKVHEAALTAEGAGCPVARSDGVLQIGRAAGREKRGQ